MIATLRFLWVALRAFRMARKTGAPGYSALTLHGVPVMAVFVGLDREAWRISQRAFEEFQIREVT